MTESIVFHGIIFDLETDIDGCATFRSAGYISPDLRKSFLDFIREHQTDDDIDAQILLNMPYHPNY